MVVLLGIGCLHYLNIYKADRYLKTAIETKSKHAVSLMLQAAPNDYYFFHRAGIIMTQRKDYELAKILLLKAYSLNPSEPYIVGNLKFINDNLK